MDVQFNMVPPCITNEGLCVHCNGLWLCLVFVFLILLWLVCILSSFPVMFLCTFTFYILIKVFQFIEYFVVSYSIILSGWLFGLWSVLVYLDEVYGIRLSVNMYVEFVSLFVILSFLCITNSSNLKMFCSPGSLYDKWISWSLLYMS
jgi:hypothetical protein